MDEVLQAHMIVWMHFYRHKGTYGLSVAGTNERTIAQQRWRHYCELYVHVCELLSQHYFVVSFVGSGI